MARKNCQPAWVRCIQRAFGGEAVTENPLKGPQAASKDECSPRGGKLQLFLVFMGWGVQLGGGARRWSKVGSSFSKIVGWAVKRMDKRERGKAGIVALGGQKGFLVFVKAGWGVPMAT